jgi:hypothetical protein
MDGRVLSVFKAAELFTTNPFINTLQAIGGACQQGGDDKGQCRLISSGIDVPFTPLMGHGRKRL